MILTALVFVAGTALADAPAKPAPRASEETLRVMLAKVRGRHEWRVREAMLGGAEELRDAVATESGAAKRQLANRLPGMARDPFGLCRDLDSCREAPQSLHVEDDALIDDAFQALARPWFKLQQARGKAVTLSVDPGEGVRLELEDLPGRAAVTLTAAPAPTGGFDVSLEEGPDAARAYAAARKIVVQNRAN